VIPLSDPIIVALIGLAGSGIGSLIGVMASSRLTEYRIEQLEKRVNAHNNLVERTYKLEGRMDEAEHDIKDLKGYHKPN
jgi:hypothetical protein